MKFNPVTWFEIYVNDMQRAARFYESVFGYTLTDMF
ncbi:MAG: VOC family protein [Taibaiella sp.]|nr:VOC family protein [Taibaiella sp.]